MNVTVECSRCHEKVDGIIDEGVTGGFYSVKEGSGWELYADVGEEVLCDHCMHTDARYVCMYKGAYMITLDEFLNLGCGVKISFMPTINDEWEVTVDDYGNRGLLEHIAETKAKDRDFAINHAYLQYLRWMDKRNNHIYN